MTCVYTSWRKAYWIALITGKIIHLKKRKLWRAHLCELRSHAWLIYIVKVGIKGSGEGGAHNGGCVPSFHHNCNTLNEVMVGLWLPWLLPNAATKVLKEPKCLKSEETPVVLPPEWSGGWCLAQRTWPFSSARPGPPLHLLPWEPTASEMVQMCPGKCHLLILLSYSLLLTQCY